METNPLEGTKPVETKPKKNKKAKKDRPRRGWWIFLGIIIVLLLGGIGVKLGIDKGVSIRLLEFEKLKIQRATMQFVLGQQDVAEGRLDTAAKRFEYVLEIDPDFPGLVDQLTQIEVSKAMQATPTVSFTATPTLEPTPDYQTQEQRFAQAQDYLRNQNWQAALDTLNSLRSIDINYMPVKVDGMYYLAYRNRGVNKILSEGKLEGGIYDLALAEQYAPIDKEANAYRQAAEYFLTGSAFWEVDWPKAVSYFSQVYASFPNLRDGSNYSAAERYRKSLIGYGDQLLMDGKYCDARDQYSLASSIGGDANFQATLSAAQLLCSPPTSTPQPTTAATAAPTDAATAEAPAAEPTTDPGS